MLLGVALFACNTSDVSRSFRVSQAERVLSGGSSKSWLRVARFENGNSVELGSCQDEQKLIFDTSTTTKVVYKIGEKSNCTATVTEPDTLINGTWELPGNVDNIITDTLLMSDPNLSLNPRVIRSLTSKFLELSYTENNGTIDVEVVEHYTF